MKNLLCHCAHDPQLVGDPVDTLTGAMVDRMLDFRLTGPIELRWYRHYDSSQAARSFSVGRGCAHEYDHGICIDEDCVIYVQPVGNVVRFPLPAADGDVCNLHGVSLRRISARCFHIHCHGRPAMEFIVHDPTQTARVGRLIKGEAEVRFEYDSGNRLVCIVDSVGRILFAEEDEALRLTRLAIAESSQAPEMLLIDYQYDTQGNLIATRNAAGHGYAFAYDADNRMVLRRGRKGFQFTFKYDDQGRCIRAMGDDQLFGVALEYVVAKRLTRVTHADLGRWTYKFDAAGHLEQVQDPLGGIRKYVRDTSGRLAVEIDPNGNASTFIYNEAGAAMAKIDSTGFRRPLPENPNDPASLTRRIAANAAEYEFGRLLNVATLALPTSVQASVLPLQPGAVPLVRRCSREIAQPRTGFQVAPIGFRWWPRPARGREFSMLGKLIAQHDDYGRTRTWDYDASGNVASYRDYDGRLWSLDYRSWHLLRGVTLPDGSKISCSYTTNGDLASVQDPGGTISEYKYDLCHRLTEVWRHGVLRERYVRDAAGNLIAKHAGDGRILLKIEIGPGNRPVKRSIIDADEQDLKYDKFGRCIAAVTSKATFTFEYDGFGKRTIDHRDGVGVASQYNATQGYRECRVFDRFLTAYRRSRDRLVIRDPTGREHAIRIFRPGLIERHLSNGTVETAQYDNAGRCQFKFASHPGRRPWQRLFHWSGEGELRRVEDSLNGDTDYTYDTTHRLKSRTQRARDEHYVFDTAGNLLSQPGLEDVYPREGNRLAAANGWQFFYNDRNHVDRKQGPSGRLDYRYDSRDQLVSVVSDEGEWTADYDPFGRRFQKIFRGLKTEYYWSYDQLIAEIQPDRRLRLYIYNDPLAICPCIFIDYDAVDAAPETGQVYFVLTDQIGAPCRVEDSKGATVWRALLRPFGKAEIDKTSSIEFHFRLPGQYCDPETGLHYNHFRYYDPVLGRYLQSDPWGTAGGLNLYAYRPNPLHLADVRGRGEETETGFDCPEDDAESLWDHTLTGGSGEDEPIEEPGGQTDAEPGSLFDSRTQALADDELPPGVGIGPFAGESIPAGPSATPTAAQQAEINRIGQTTGCHNCGTTDPGTTSGNFIGDHQPPTELNTDGGPQNYYPHCDHCSRTQGGIISQM